MRGRRSITPTQSVTLPHSILVEFALGFGCHIANDEVDRHSNGFSKPSDYHVIKANSDANLFRKDGDTFSSKKITTTEDTINPTLVAAQSWESNHIAGNGENMHAQESASVQIGCMRSLKTRKDNVMKKVRPSLLHSFSSVPHNFHLIYLH